MKTHYIVNTMIILLMAIYTKGQSKIDRPNELQTGDKLEVKNTFSMLNDKLKQVNLSQYNDRLLVIDFFDTFCTACIAKMPEIVSLQKEFGDNIKLIQATWQDKKTIEDFFKKNRFLKEHQAYPPVIYGDTLLHQLFPHQGVPHVVWIWKGKVLAITAADVLNSKNIKEFIANGTITLPRKNDFLPQRSEAQSVQGHLMYSKLSAFDPNVSRSAFTYENDSITGGFRSCLNNLPIMNAYLSILTKIHKKYFLVTKDRLVWKVRDRSIYQYEDNEKEPSKWLEKHAICYERRDLRKRDEIEQAKLALSDLNNFLGLDVYYGKAKRKCLVIKKTTITDTPTAIKEATQNLEGTAVLAFILDYSKKFPPVVDDVQTKTNIALGEYNDLVDLNVQLSAYGLRLEEEEREIDVLVFEEK